MTLKYIKPLMEDNLKILKVEYPSNPLLDHTQIVSFSMEENLKDLMEWKSSIFHGMYHCKIYFSAPVETNKQTGKKLLRLFLAISRISLFRSLGKAAAPTAHS